MPRKSQRRWNRDPRPVTSHFWLERFRACGLARFNRIPTTAFLWLAILGLMALAGGSSAGTWAPLTRTAPGSVGLMLLLSDGTVMAQNSGTSAAWYRLTPDIHGGYTNGTWTTLAAMHDTRLYFSSDVLRDGRVFVAGGEYGTGKRTGELYDPLCNCWTMAPVSGQSFSDSVSKVIANGNVLVAPVGPSSSGFTVIFNIVSNTWITGPKLFRGSYQDEASWVKLPDGSILTVDPFGVNSERYLPASNTWVNDGVVPVSLYDSFGSELGGAILLPDGRAFFLGATGHSAYYTPSGNNSPGTWTAGPDIPSAKGTPDAAAAMMVNGKILCAVSPVPTSADHFPTPTSFYEFDYTANTFTLINGPTGATLNGPSYVTTMLDLPDGTVLFSHFANQLYVYQPGGAPLAAGKPAISDITQNADSTFHLTGTRLNGICEGAVYGDDWQMDSNYPIIRLTDASNNVHYARTINWSSTGVMTGETPVSTDFVLPAGLAAGTYSLVVAANGNSSDPVSFEVAPIVISLPASAVEGAAPVAATVTLPSVAVSDQTVTLSSSRPGRATVPSEVTVLAGQTSAAFDVTIVDDPILNGSQPVMISASSSGYQGGLAYIVVQDNESAVLVVTPSTGVNASGVWGGPFSVTNIVYTLTNTGNIMLSWAVSDSANWLDLSPTSGVLAPGSKATVTATINSSANTLGTGLQTDTIIFNNNTNGNGNTSRTVSLSVTGSPVMVVSPAGVSASGFAGGPFSPSSTVLTVSNLGNAPLGWSVTKTSAWVTLSTAGGQLLPGANTSLTVTINTNANSLAAANYADTLSFTNKTNNVGNTTRPVALAVNLSAPLLGVLPGGGFTATGPYGGPFVPPSATYTVTNRGNSPLSWAATNTADWLTLTPSGGTLAGGAKTSVVATLNATANVTPAGAYSDTMRFVNLNTGAGNTARGASLSIVPAAPVLAAEPPFTSGDTNLISWGVVPGATNYETQIAVTPDFASPLLTQASADPSVTFSNLTDGTAYFYRSRALVLALTSPWSEAASSTQDAVPPLVQISSPVTNGYTTRSNVLVRGTASDTLSGLASVEVNGLAASSTNGFADWSVMVPLLPGTNTLAVSAFDRAETGGNQATASALVVRLADTTGGGLPDDWKIAHGLDPNSNDGDNGPLGDPDHDGRPNLLEYALNGDPQLAEANPVQCWIATDAMDGLTYLMCSFPRRPGALDLVAQIQMSEDLLTWTSPSERLEEVGVTPNADGITETVTLRLQPAIVPGTRNFIRASVNLR